MTPNPTNIEISTSKSQNMMGQKDIMSNHSEGEYVWTLSKELAQLAKKQLGEEPAIRESCLVKMRSWIKRKPHLAACRTDNVFLLRFLRARKFNLEKACDNFEGYMKMRTSNPDWFINIDPCIPNVEELAKNGYCTVLPGRDKEKRKVLFSYVNKIDLNRHINSDIVKLNIASLETLMEDEENQIRGITYVFYCKDITLAHCSIWTPTDAHKLFGTCEKGLAIRHSDINLVHMPFCLWAVVEFVKQILTNKIKSRINGMSSDEKLAKKLGAGILPSDIGGSGKSLEEMAEDWHHILVQNRPQLLDFDQQIIDTSDKESNQAIVAKSGFWSLIPGL